AELAVVADAEHRKPGGYRLDRVALPDIERQIVLRHQQTPARVDVESARVDLLGIGVLDRLRLAGRLIDRVDHDAVLAALEHLLALIVDRLFGAVGAVEKPAVRMDMHRACRLPRPDVVRLGERLGLEDDLRIDFAVLHPEHVHFVLRLDRHVHPRLVGWKSRWRGPNSLPPFGAMETSFFRTPLLYSKTFRAPGSSALVGVPSLPRVTSTASLLSGVVRI